MSGATVVHFAERAGAAARKPAPQAVLRTLLRGLPADLCSGARNVFTVLWSYMNDEGGGIFPSAQTIARLAGMQERQVHENLSILETEKVLADDGWQANGHAGVKTRRRRINLDLLRANAANADAGQSANARPRKKRVALPMRRDWKPPAPYVQFAKQSGMTPEEISDAAEYFRDWGLATGAARRDWFAVWRVVVEQRQSGGPSLLP